MATKLFMNICYLICNKFTNSFAKADSSLLELTLLFNKIKGFQKFIYKLVVFNQNLLFYA